MIVLDMGRNFRLRIPTKPGTLVHASIEIDQRSGGIHSDLVIAVDIGIKVDLNRVAVPKRLIFVFLGGNV